MRSARATVRIRTDFTPRTLNDWGALGGVVGRPGGQLLVGAGGGGPGRRAGFGRAQALWRGDGQLRLDRAVPPGRHHARSGAACRTWAAIACRWAHRIGEAEVESAAAGLCGGRRDRRGGVLRAAVEPVRTARPRRAVPGPQVRAAAAGGDQPAGQARCRPHGLHRAHRGGRRHGAFGHVLLPVLCPRSGRGQRLEAAGHQQRQAGQHSRRLWPTCPCSPRWSAACKAAETGRLA